MSYLKRIISSLSFRNFARGFDETVIYGPLCITFVVIVLGLFLLKIVTLESLILSFAVLAYMFFFYFPLHKSKIILVGHFFITLPLFIFGIFTFYYGIVTFPEIKALSITWWIYCFITALFISLASIRRSLKEADGWFSTAKNIGGIWVIPPLIILALSAFVLFAGSYALLGQNHLLPWIIIFVVWGISDIRLLIYKIIKRTKSHTA